MTKETRKLMKTREQIWKQWERLEAKERARRERVWALSDRMVELNDASILKRMELDKAMTQYDKWIEAAERRERRQANLKEK